MKIRIAQGLSSVCCALALFSQPLAAETLREIYLQALENDHTFKAAQADRDAGLENRALGRSALLPQISGNASWSRAELDSERTQTLRADGNGAPAIVETPAGKYDIEQTSYGVNLRQSIIDLGNWHNYARGKALANVAQAEFALAEENLILRTASAYFDALKAVDTLATAKAQEDALSHQLEQTRQRFAVGLTAITEVHEAQAAYDSATANRLVAAGNLGIAFEALEVLTGQTYQSLAPLLTDFPVQPPQPAARDEWVKMALDNNAQLQAAKFAAESAEANAKALKSEHLPTLSGSVNYGGSQQDREDLRFEDQTSASVSLDLAVPLFTGGYISAARRQAYAQYLSAREQYLQTQRDIVQDTRSTHLNVLTAAATVKARQQAITSSRSALEATQAGYDVGTRDLVDVLNAQQNLFSAQQQYYDALYSYVVATLLLKQAAGILAGEDVAQLDQWLDKSRSVNYTR